MNPCRYFTQYRVIDVLPFRAVAVPLNEGLPRRKPIGRVGHMPSSHDFFGRILSATAQHLSQFKIERACGLIWTSRIYAACSSG